MKYLTPHQMRNLRAEQQRDPAFTWQASEPRSGKNQGLRQWLTEHNIDDYEIVVIDDPKAGE